MSCVNQYELDLRGCRIATIENLGATEVSQIYWKIAAMHQFKLCKVGTTQFFCRFFLPPPLSTN